MIAFGNLTAQVRKLQAAFKANRRGGVAMIVGFAAVPLTIGVGMGIDYSLAAGRHNQINAIADSAVLAGLTPSMMSMNSTAAQNATSTMFLKQLATVQGVNFDASSVKVVVTDTPTAAGLQRNISLSYSASSPNIFASMLGMTSTPLSGTSGASNSQSPNINYYLLLDSSPSMAIAATTAGINTMVANTSKQGGCAFACHQTNPAADNLGNPNGEDNYALARNLGVTLRIDLVNSATQDMLSSAQTTSATNNSAYQFAIYSFDASVHTLQTLTTATGNSSAAITASAVATAKASAANLQMLTTYSNGYISKGVNDNDQDTNFDLAMNTLYSIMPKPGNGTAIAGDTPQEVLFIVSDGVVDEAKGGRLIQAMGANSTLCTQFKNEGIRIAFLYTTYYPLTTNSFYNNNVAPFQAKIGPTYAKGCASDGLYYSVSTDGDISSAMTALFQATVKTAHLTQ